MYTDKKIIDRFNAIETALEGLDNTTDLPVEISRTLEICRKQLKEWSDLLVNVKTQANKSIDEYVESQKLLWDVLKGTYLLVGSPDAVMLNMRYITLIENLNTISESDEDKTQGQQITDKILSLLKSTGMVTRDKSIEDFDMEIMEDPKRNPFVTLSSDMNKQEIVSQFATESCLNIKKKPDDENSKHMQAARRRTQTAIDMSDELIRTLPYLQILIALTEYEKMETLIRIIGPYAEENAFLYSTVNALLIRMEQIQSEYFDMSKTFDVNLTAKDVAMKIVELASRVDELKRDRAREELDEPSSQSSGKNAMQRLEAAYNKSQEHNESSTGQPNRSNRPNVTSLGPSQAPPDLPASTNQTLESKTLIAKPNIISIFLKSLTLKTKDFVKKLKNLSKRFKDKYFN